ncbi:MAG: alpha/beta hydrolase [Vulcanimicrobiaceae bacterium]
MGNAGSILFVHGAGHGAWCWHEHFTGWFERCGYTVAAPDLPHHGDLDRQGINRATLSTYVDAVANAVAGLKPPVILVGHSMGGLIIQKYLETSRTALAILLASMPPNRSNRIGMVMRVARRHPDACLKNMLTGKATDSPKRTRDYYFSTDTPADIVNNCHRRLQPESMRVLMDVNVSLLRPKRVGTPVVVLGAEADWLITPKDLHETARAFNTTAHTLPGGHDMMLDTAWEQVAATIETTIVEHLASEKDLTDKLLG